MLLVLLWLAIAGVRGDDSKRVPLMTISGDAWEVAIRWPGEFWGVLVVAPPDKCGEACEQAERAFERIGHYTTATMLFGKTQYDSEVHFGNGPGGQRVFERFNLTTSTPDGSATSVRIPSMVVVFPVPHGMAPSELVLPPEVVMGITRAPLKQQLQQLKGFFPHAMTKLSTSTLGSFLAVPDDLRRRQKLLVVSSKPTPSLPASRLSLAVLGSADTGLVRASQTAVIERLEGVEAGKGGLYVSDASSLPPPGTPADEVDPASVRWLRYEGRSAGYEQLRAWAMPLLGGEMPVVPVLSGPKDFERACVAPGGICVVGVLSRGSVIERLPPLTNHDDAQGGDLPTPVPLLAHAASKVYGRLDADSLGRGEPRVDTLPVRFYQVDGSTQRQWADALGVQATPTVVALNARTGRFAVFAGAFTPHVIHDWVVDVLAGKVALEKAGDSFPSLAATEPTRYTPPSGKPAKKKKKKTKTKQKKKKTKSKGKASSSKDEL